MPVLAIDLATREGRLRLVYASAICLFGAVASRLSGGSLLLDASSQDLFWSGAVALAPLLLFGWRALPAAAALSVFIEFLTRRDLGISTVAAIGDIAEASASLFVIRKLMPFDPRFRKLEDFQRFILAGVVLIPAVAAAIGMMLASSS